MNDYKSPYAASLWSFALPGCGQFYNGQILLGLILLILELIINKLAHLNLSISETFHGDFTKAHNLIDFHWGMFYPSIWSFSMWQAYNKARAINAFNNEEKIHETKLTGFFFGTVFGMNIGIYIHFPFLDNNKYFFFMNSPILVGFILGILFGFIGKWVEKKIRKKLILSE